MIWVAGRSPTLVSHSLRGVAMNLKATTLTYLAIVLFLDACHLCWGDVCGYGWGRSDMRAEIPMANERRRQTYFGALNDETKEFILCEWCE
jgi:hypothetical protein